VLLFFFEDGAKTICNASCGTVDWHQIPKYVMITKKQNSANVVIVAELGFISAFIYYAIAIRL